MAFIPPTPTPILTPISVPLRSSTFVSSPPLRVSKSTRFTHARLQRHRAERARVSMQVLDIKTYDVFMPALSSTMSEGRIVQWLKQPGDPIDIGEPIMVVESDKADMDVEAFEKGFLATILVQEGDSCEVGQTVGIIVESKDDIDKVGASPSSAPPTSRPDAPTPSASAPPQAVAAPSSEPPSAPPAAKPDFFEVFMPALSSTMTEGKVVEWLKGEGDAVTRGEMIMVVESDKADMDVESFEDGFLAHISVDAGGSSPVGDAVALLAKSKSEIPAVKAWASAQAAGAASGSSQVVAPAPPSARPSAALDPTAVLPSSGPPAIVNEGRIVASPRAKVVAKEMAVDLRTVSGTGPNGRIVEDDVITAYKTGPATESAQAVHDKPADKVIATPDAKKIAKKEKIDIASVTGTGNFGRITAEDVLKAAGKSPKARPYTSTPVSEQSGGNVAPSNPSTPAAIAPVPEGAVTMNAMQKAVVHNMNASLTVPVFHVTYKIKTAALDELYSNVKQKGVTMSALIAKAVAIALTKNPVMNAQYSNDCILYRPNIHVAMAVSLKDGGLITPTLKNADKTDLYSMSRNWKDLVKRALGKKLTPDEYSSGTFFVSNMGMLGVDQFDAILPPGAPGILAIGASQPVVGLQSNGLIGVEKEMKVTLTADHRHIYGADGAKFLQDLASVIEGNVTQLLM